MDVKAEARTRGVLEEFESRAATGAKFSPADLAGDTMSPMAGELHAFAVDYAKAYDGDFGFMQEMAAIARRGNGGPPLSVLSVGQAKAVLNCMLADVRRSARAREDGGRSTNPDPVTEPGIYERGGFFFKVQRSRQSDNLYAKRAVESSRRLTETGEVVEFDFVYAPGAIRDLHAGDRMNEERAKELAIRYGSCINCGRTLKVAKSVERGIGPVCIKRFRW